MGMLLNARLRGSSLTQEIRGGVTTFLTMSYVLLLNPQLLMQVGLNPNTVVLGTALSSCLATFICGYFGNLPFGLAPGIGLTTYLVFGLVFNDGLSVEEAFAGCFISGCILCLFACLGLTGLIMKVIPKSIKYAIIVGMGLQIAFIGLTSAEIVVANNKTLIGLGPIHKKEVWISICGLVLIGLLLHHRVTGAILIGIVSISLLTWQLDNSFPTHFLLLPDRDMFQTLDLSLSSIRISKLCPAILSFLFVGIVDVSGVTFGMASLSNIVDEHGHVPGSLFAFLGCAAGTMVGAFFGSSPVIAYVESAAGIKDGARTGVSALVVALLFLASVFLAPLFSQVPAA